MVSFCHETLKLNGSIPVLGRAAIEYPNETLTAVVGVTVDPHDVLFLATSAGHVMKVLIARILRSSDVNLCLFNELPEN